MTEVKTRCPFCAKEHSVNVSMAGYRNWLNGMLIQDAMPGLSATEREQLISGICPSCQDSIFGVEDEFDEDEE